MKKLKGFFKRQKATTKVKPLAPAVGSAEKKTAETSVQEGTK